jgi:hypothetical protein
MVLLTLYQGNCGILSRLGDLGLLINTEDGIIMFLRIVGKLLPGHTAPYRRMQWSLWLQPSNFASPNVAFFRMYSKWKHVYHKGLTMMRV